MGRELRLRSLPFIHSQWFEFLDAKLGRGFAETDYILERDGEVILLEVKLTGGAYGKLQMLWLYKPILEVVYRKPVRCLLVCRNPTQGCPEPFVDSVEAFLAGELELATWHWMG